MIARRTVQDTKLSYLEEYPEVMKQLESTWRKKTHELQFNTFDVSSSRQNTSRKLNDPVLECSMVGEDVQPTLHGAMSARYKRSFKFI